MQKFEAKVFHKRSQQVQRLWGWNEVAEAGGQWMGGRVGSVNSERKSDQAGLGEEMAGWSQRGPIAPQLQAEPPDGWGSWRNLGLHNPGQLLSCPVLKVKSLSRVQLFVTPWTVVHQAPLSMGFSGYKIKSLKVKTSKWILLFAATWMHWEILIQRNIKSDTRQKYHSYPLYAESKMMVQMCFFTKETGTKI